MYRSRANRLVRLFFVMCIGSAMLLAAACGGGGGGPNTQRNEQAQRDQGGGTQVAAGNPENGRRLYATTCATCHGQTGEGIAGLGKDLTNSAFVRDRTDQQLVEFLKVGRRANDPENSTGIDMPPRGGNPSLTDQDLADIVAYMRQLQR